MKIHHFALIIAASAVISSCSKEQNLASEEEISVTEVSERIVSFVDNNYPDAYIYSAVQVSNSTARTIITLNTSEELAFTTDDNFLGNGELFHAGEHGGPNGHGHGHGGMGHGGMGHGNGNGHCHGFNHGEFNSIPIDSLPPSITTYISTNYSGYQILHAEQDSSCAVGEVIEVLIHTTGSEPVKLIFDPTGNYLMSASRINYSSTPAAVQSSITTNYAGYTPRPRSEQITLAGGQLQYVVYLFNGTTHKRVILADDGSVICEQ